MSRIVLNWEQAGSFDFFNIYRSESTMPVSDMPLPVVINLLIKQYVDNDVVTGVTYYYRVGVSRNGLIKYSDEVNLLASNDPNLPYLINDLNFDNQTLFDVKTQSNWSFSGNNYAYVQKDNNYALSLGGSTYIQSPNNVVATGATLLTLTFDMWFDATSPSTCGVFVFGGGSSSLYLERYGSGAGFSLTYANYGSGFTEEIAFSTPTNTKHRFHVVKNTTSIKVYVNGVLAISKTAATSFQSAKIGIGKNELSNSGHMKGIVDNVKLYVGVAIEV